MNRRGKEAQVNLLKRTLRGIAATVQLRGINKTERTTQGRIGEERPRSECKRRRDR